MTFLMTVISQRNHSPQRNHPPQCKHPPQCRNLPYILHQRERNVSEKDAIDEPMSSFSLESNVPVEAAVNEPMLPSALEEDVHSEPVAEAPRPPPIPTPAYQRRGPSDQQRFRSSSNYFNLLKKLREWSNDLSRFSLPPNFERSLTVNKQYNNRSTPLSYFRDMFPESSRELVNLIVRNTNIYVAYKCSRHWKDTTYEEVNAYFGLMVLISIKSIPDIKMYNETFQKNCSSSQNQSIDESMIKFKGKSFMKQYMPKKPIKRGYKSKVSLGF
ncbi:unnamed protein product [Parnassius apollo]|uniref:(apollo) hypothetical protein n=1 Tax=Parnassius apollo TaxID=110799 RepID=A0A8S3W1K7_PARAO|nr:unnamed protein product [Parnassius apollo]